MTRARAVVLISVATLLAYAPVISTGFVDYDDDIYVSANTHIQAPIDDGSLRWALTSFYASNWHPVTWLSHMIDWTLYGPNPLGHHLTSLFAHLAAALVLFFALDRMTQAAGRSAFAAALFAVHPLHVESVVWLAERKDVLCALFWFLAIGAYALWREKPRLPLRWAIGLFAALSLMSKPMAVTLPLTLLLFDFWPLGGKRPRSAVAAVWEKAPLFVLAAAGAWLTVMAQHAGRSIAAVAACPFEQRLGNAIVVYVGYLVKTIWPVQLAAFYPHPGGTLPAGKIAGALVALTLVSVVALRLRRKNPYILFGWLWYLITLVPVIGLVQVGQQGMADRYTYVPLVGIFIAVSWGAYDAVTSFASGGHRRRFLPAATIPAIVVVLILIGVTRFQVGFWKNGETLWRRALAVTERNDVAHTQLGLLRGRQGRLAEADAHFREAVRIHPSSAQSHRDLGANLLRLGKPDEAAVELRVALRLDPNDARTHLGLGDALERQGRLDEAVAQFDTALRIDPSSADAHDRAGTALAQLGRNDEAHVHFGEAIRIDPLRADTQCNWGTALATQRRYREAVTHFVEAIRLSPKFARAHFSLAAASFFLEDYEGAWREAKLARSYGFEPPASFLSMLSARMAEPQ